MSAVVTTLVLFFIIVILSIINLKLVLKLKEMSFKKRSIASSYGKIVEQLVPFMDGFPGDPKKFRFIGSPIDGIIFDEDEIKFVEIKTRGGKLSETQKRIKKLVEKKRIGWYEVTVK